jgi:hypothetical protein
VFSLNGITMARPCGTRAILDLGARLAEGAVVDAQLRQGFAGSKTD